MDQYLLEQLDDDELDEYLELQEQLLKECVSPKLEAFREPAPYKSACGGRGAGAKTTGVASLLVQNMEQGKIKKWLCARETHESLEESSFASIWEQVEFLGYKGWKKVPSRSRIVNLKTGGYFKFGGVGDIASVTRKKSLQSYDGVWVEECHNIPMAVWDILLPTFRKANAEVWTTFNREQEEDPVYKLFFINPPEGTISIELKEGKIDNPWFPDILQRQLEHMYKTRPEMALHVWGGQPLAQGADAIIPRVKVRAAMDRVIEFPVGKTSVGCDPADLGDDKTQMYKRKGYKVIAHKELVKMVGSHVGNELKSFVSGDPSVEMRIDTTGIGTSVRDKCVEHKLKVFPINFASSASDKDKYANIVTEMWFNIADIIDQLDIPDDPELMQELSGRKYKYDGQGRYVIEPKAEFKKRIGRSPDKADALILTFYQGGNIMMSDEDFEDMSKMRGR